MRPSCCWNGLVPLSVNGILKSPDPTGSSYRMKDRIHPLFGNHSDRCRYTTPIHYPILKSLVLSDFNAAALTLETARANHRRLKACRGQIRVVLFAKGDPFGRGIQEDLRGLSRDALIRELHKPASCSSGWSSSCTPLAIR